MGGDQRERSTHHGLRHGTRGRRGFVTGDRADADADEGGLLHLDPVDDHPDEERRRRGDLRVDRRKGAARAGRVVRAAIEAKPAEPKERRAEGDKGDVVRLVGGLLLGDLHARAKAVDGSEGREAGGRVHDDAARKVPNAPASHPAAAPHPVAEGRVDENDPEGDEDEVGREADAVGERARHERRRDDREHALVAREDKGRNAGDHRSPIDAAEEEVGGRVAEELARVGAEAERVTDDEPHDRDHAHRAVVLHDHRHDRLPVQQSGVEERETGEHELDEGHRDEHPRGVTRVDGERGRIGRHGWGELAGGSCARGLTGLNGRLRAVKRRGWTDECSVGPHLQFVTVQAHS